MGEANPLALDLDDARSERLAEPVSADALGMGCGFHATDRRLREGGDDQARRLRRRCEVLEAFAHELTEGLRHGERLAGREPCLPPFEGTCDLEGEERVARRDPVD